MPDLHMYIHGHPSRSAAAHKLTRFGGNGMGPPSVEDSGCVEHQRNLRDRAGGMGCMQVSNSRPHMYGKPTRAPGPSSYVGDMRSMPRPDDSLRSWMPIPPKASSSRLTSPSPSPAACRFLLRVPEGWSLVRFLVLAFVRIFFRSSLPPPTRCKSWS